MEILFPIIVMLLIILFFISFALFIRRLIINSSVKAKTLQRNEELKVKKLFSLMLITTIILAACNSTELSITEIQSIPTKVQDRINTDYTLQLVNDSKKGDAYIIFQASGTVTAQLEVRENILDIKLDNEGQENSELKQYVYKVTRGDAEYDTVNVLINGQASPIDNASGF